MERVPDLLLSIGPMVLILSMHLVLACLVRRKVALPGALLRLGGVVLFSSAVWFIVTYFLAASFAECCFEAQSEPFAITVFNRTLELPFAVCYDFPQLQDSLGIRLCSILGFISLPGGLLILGLLVFLLVRPPPTLAD